MYHMTPLFFWKFSQDYCITHNNTHVMCFLGLKTVLLNYFGCQIGEFYVGSFPRYISRMGGLGHPAACIS